MTKRNFLKIIVFSLVWATFLSLLITNWKGLTSARWQDLGDTVKAIGITEFVKNNADDVFFFGLCALFLLLWSANSLRKANRRNLPENLNTTGLTYQTEVDGEEEVKLGNNVDIIINPAYRSMSCNIHHRWHGDRISKKTET
ncbi:MAG: hypothetical protein PHD01_05855 [Geobacteraceae bacterium]|nr:hypothetical protein [Geobacteraceae bacterium]